MTSYGISHCVQRIYDMRKTNDGTEDCTKYYVQTEITALYSGYFY
jgi:hypothetical protein